MGSLILCSGNLAKVPYILKNTNQKIYCMEELCYYLYNNITTAEDFLFDEGLVSFIGTELGLTERAKQFGELLQNKASLKDVAITLLCSTDLYTRKDLDAFLKEADRLGMLQSWQKQKQKADSYLERGDYRDAANILERLLQEQQGEELKDALLGDIYHNLGICRLRMTGVQDALPCFAEAYEKKHREESLFAYLSALRLTKRMAEYESAVAICKVTPEQQEKLNRLFVKYEEKRKESSLYQEMQQLKESFQCGKMSEYNKTFSNIMYNWKQQYRMEQKTNVGM